MHFNWPASEALIVTGECQIRTFLLSTQTVVEDRNVEFLRITNVCICNLSCLIFCIDLYVEC